MGHEGEASVEEILESIKKVIARDNRATAIDVRRRRETAGMDAMPEPADEDEADEVDEADEPASDRVAPRRERCNHPAEGAHGSDRHDRVRRGDDDDG
mgnify:CR=1 FL=1